MPSRASAPEVAMDVEALRPGLRCPRLERVHPGKDEARFYLASSQPTLSGWAVERSYGRMGRWQRLIPPLPFGSLEEAWPLVRAIIKRRLRHGYRVMEPEQV